MKKESAFVFSRDGKPSQTKARALREFVSILGVVPDEILDGHLRRGDFSRWVDNVFGDHALATQISELEGRHRVGHGIYVRDAIAQLVEESYALSSAQAVSVGL